MADRVHTEMRKIAARNLRRILNDDGRPPDHLSNDTLRFYEERGWIVRRRDERGRRTRICDLTEAGQAMAYLDA